MQSSFMRCNFLRTRNLMHKTMYIQNIYYMKYIYSPPHVNPVSALTSPERRELAPVAQIVPAAVPPKGWLTV